MIRFSASAFHQRSLFRNVNAANWIPDHLAAIDGLTLVTMVFTYPPHLRSTHQTYHSSPNEPDQKNERNKLQQSNHVWFYRTVTFNKENTQRQDAETRRLSLSKKAL
jgi:hypothetical protein